MKLIQKKSIWSTLFLIIILYIIKISFGNGDFKVYLEAAELISSGESPYNKWLEVSQGNYCLYFYSPLWALFLVPFTYLPSFIPNFIWLLANLYFLYRIWIISINYFSNISITKHQQFLILVLSLIFSIRFILYNFEMIQMTLFLLWGILESIGLFEKKKFILGGLLLALIINIKILPIIIIPYLIYRAKFNSLISTLLWSVILLFLPAIFIGWSTNLQIVNEWWGVINPSNPEHVIETDLGPHSLTALIPTLLSNTSGAIEYTRNIIALSAENATLVLNIIRLILIMATIYFVKWPPFSKTKSKIDMFRTLSYLMLLIPLIFPHQQKFT